jgi:hypothetical protein
MVEGGLDAASFDATGDATSDAPAEATGDALPSDAAEDVRSDAACFVDSDCHSSFPDVCNICPSPLNHLVCVSGQCICACRADAGGD